jgi:hypothetical protein
MSELQSSDVIAHLLATNVGSPVRFFLVDETATVPTTPYRDRSGVETTTVPLSSFDAVVERADVDDGGLSLTSFGGIHLPESEWRRIGLEKHWHAEDVDLEAPFTDPRRRLELWASREDNLWDQKEPEDPPYDHLEDVPEDSPLITEWDAHSPDDYPSRPYVPFDRPTLSVYALHAEGAGDPRGFDRVEVGEIARVDILDESDLDEWPEAPDIETRELDVSLTPPPRHPDVDYADLDTLSQTNDVLQSIYTVNRHAKRFDEQATSAYHAGQGAEARAYSLRKRALYRTKTVAIHRLGKADPTAVRVVRHELNGNNETYCLYFTPVDRNEDREYSFHQPLDAVEPELLQDVTGSDDRSTLPLETISFDTTSETDSLERSLSDAISTLRAHDLDPNDYLDATVVEDYEWGYQITTTFS